MFHRLVSLSLFTALVLFGCADSTETERTNLENANTCSNSSSPCYCITDADCPTGTVCQIADSPPPPYQGICWPADQICHDNTPDNSTACCNANDANCPPPKPGCSNTDPNCAPPPPPGCNAGNANCP